MTRSTTLRGAATRSTTLRGAATLALLALAASLLQLGAVPALFLGGVAAPLLPVALIAAWTMARGERELWPALLVVAAVMGVASSERIGWFLLALLPAALLAALDGVADRGARFCTAIALVMPSGEELVSHGELVGIIGTKPRGEGGFGYDPIFEVDGRTLAEMGVEEKNKISHRARAMAAMAEMLRSA